MRKLSQLPVVKQVDSDFPNGAIKNETDINEGTPVVREIYNDPLVNLYKILDLAGVVFDGTEDKEGKYQLVEAIRKLPNLLNDIEQVLTLSGGVWSVPFNLTYIPTKYVFFARASDAYTPGTFKGLNASPSYSFTSSGFAANDELLVVIDVTEVRAYSLSSITGNSVNEIFTVMGIPLQYNTSNTVYYHEYGELVSGVPRVEVIEETIRAFVSDNSVIVTDMFIMQGMLLCVVYFPIEITYRFYDFSLGDLTDPTLITPSGFSVNVGVDFAPYFYADENNLYISNNNGTSTDDNEICINIYSPGALAFGALLTMDNSFVKTTNAAIKDKKIYTFVNGLLCYFDINTGVKTTIGQFSGVLGQIFSYKDDIYFTSGEVALKWF